MTGFVRGQMVDLVGGQGAFEDIDLTQLSHKSVPSEHDVAGVVVDNRVVVHVFAYILTVDEHVRLLSDLVVVRGDVRPLIEGQRFGGVILIGVKHLIRGRAGQSAVKKCKIVNISLVIGTGQNGTSQYELLVRDTRIEIDGLIGVDPYRRAVLIKSDVTIRFING